MEQLASIFFHSRTQAHAFHLETRGPGSLAIHLALNTYYDEIVGLMDGLKSRGKVVVIAATNIPN
mgnify:CR=1 FL=1